MLAKKAICAEGEAVCAEAVFNVMKRELIGGSIVLQTEAEGIDDASATSELCTTAFELLVALQWFAGQGYCLCLDGFHAYGVKQYH